MNPSLTIGLFDDSDDGLVFMEDLVDVVLLFLRTDKHDVELRKAADHREAERLAATGECDLILVDLMWPIAAGAEWREGLNVVEIAKAANQETTVVVITNKADREERFRDESRRRGADLALEWDEAFGSGKVGLAKDLANRLAPIATWAVPAVKSIERMTIGLVGLDTVAFSEEDDATQIRVVKSFLGFMNEAWEQVAQPFVRPIFVFTGDGLFLGIEGNSGPRLALDVGVAAWRGFAKLAGYRVRLAVHTGPVNVVTLTTGGHQMLGHAVNWLFRAVGEAPENGLVMTEEYYRSALSAGREVVPGLAFTPREGVAKHQRPIVVYDVTETG